MEGCENRNWHQEKKRTLTSVNKTELLIYITVEKHLKLIISYCKHFSITAKLILMEYPTNFLGIDRINTCYVGLKD